MKEFFDRNLRWLVATIGGLALLSVILNVFLISRLGGIESDIETNTADLERVEAGAALFAAQVTGFTDQLAELGPAVSSGLDQAIAGLEAFRTSTIEFQLAVDETVQIDAVIDLNRTLTVPINETLSINEVIQTTVTVQGPFGIDIPVDITVPVQVEVPVVLDLAIPVNEMIPLSADVPIRLTIPLAVAVEGTELAALADALQIGLAAFKDVIAGLG